MPPISPFVYQGPGSLGGGLGVGSGKKPDKSDKKTTKKTVKKTVKRTTTSASTGGRRTTQTRVIYDRSGTPVEIGGVIRRGGRTYQGPGYQRLDAFGKPIAYRAPKGIITDTRAAGIGGTWDSPFRGRYPRINPNSPTARQEELLQRAYRVAVKKGLTEPPGENPFLYVAGNAFEELKGIILGSPQTVASGLTLLSPTTSLQEKGTVVKDMGGAVIEDWRYRYVEPVVRRDFGMFLSRAAERPFSTTLDALAIKGIAGKGVSRLGRRAGRMTEGRAARIPKVPIEAVSLANKYEKAALIRRASDPTVPKADREIANLAIRYLTRQELNASWDAQRASRLVRGKVADALQAFGEFTRDDTRPGSGRIKRDKVYRAPQRGLQDPAQPVAALPDRVIPGTRRRLRSKNPIDRAIQAYVTEPIGQKLRDIAPDVSPVRRPRVSLRALVGRSSEPFISTTTTRFPLSRGKLYDSSFGKAGYDIASASRAAESVTQAAVVKPLDRAKYVAPPEEVNTWVEVMAGGNDPKVMTAKWRAERERILSSPNPQDRAAQLAKMDDTIRRWESIPDYLKSDTLPHPDLPASQSLGGRKAMENYNWKLSRELLADARTVSRRGEAMAVDSTRITPVQAELGRNKRYMIEQGAMPLRDFAARERQKIKEVAADNPEQAREMRRALSQRIFETLMRTPGGAGNAYARLVRQHNVNMAARSEARAAGDFDAFVKASSAASESRRDLGDMRAKLLDKVWEPGDYRAENAPPGAFYVRDVSATRPASRRNLAGGTPGPGLSTPKAKRSRGVLFGRGDFANTDVRSQVVADAKNAVISKVRPPHAERLIDDVALKDGDGNLITGVRAETIVKNSGGLYELMSRRQLVNILEQSGARGSDALKDFAAADGPLSEKFAIPSASVEMWRRALGPGKFPRLANFNALFKGVVLPLKPAWYVQNFVGNSFQFFLQAGPDLRSIIDARMPEMRDLVPDRIKAGFAGEARTVGEVSQGTEVRLGPYGRFRRSAFHVNDMFEAWIKNMSFAVEMRRLVKADPVLGKRGRLSDAQLASGLNEVSAAAARREPWAEALLEEATRVSTRFLGDYVKYSWFEREFVKNAIPFYGWIRTVFRLGFSLPMAHPIRTALLNSVAQAAAQVYGLNEIYDQTGRQMVFFGDKNSKTAIATEASSPFSVAMALAESGQQAAEKSDNFRDFILNFGKESLRSVVTTDVTPALTVPLAMAGINTGQFAPSYSPGYQGVVLAPGTNRPMLPSPRGVVMDTAQTPGVVATIQRYIPPAQMIMRSILGEMTPTSDATLPGVVGWAARGKPQSEAYQYVRPAPRTGRVFNQSVMSRVVGQFVAGTPWFDFDRDALRRQAQQRTDQLIAGWKKQMSDKKKARP